MQTSRDTDAGVTRTALRPSASTQRRRPARRYTMASSTAEQASTSRTSTTESPQLGPISQFEHHLKYLSDSYLSFFQERHVLRFRSPSEVLTFFSQSEGRGCLVSSFSLSHPLTRLSASALFSVESLNRLHKKAKAFDIYLDDRRDSTTLRQAWSEVRDGVERGKLANPIT